MKMQGKEKNIIHFVDLINGFIEKLSNWRRKVQISNFAMFTSLVGISVATSATSTTNQMYKVANNTWLYIWNAIYVL